MQLTKTEARILQLLQQHRGEVVNTRTIYETVWKQRFLSTSQDTVTVHILHLRRKLGNRVTIRTVWGRGYTLD